MTKAEIYAQWQRRLDAHNAKPETGEGQAVYRCRRCGGTFARRIGATPPTKCPACYFTGWLDPEAKITPWHRKRKADGNG